MHPMPVFYREEFKMIAFSSLIQILENAKMSKMIEKESGTSF